MAIGVLEKILGSRFCVTGLENLPNQPIMFASNHFTRSETFFVPYLIYKHTGRQIRCLADSSLHKGMLGRFLQNVGTLSTKDPKRDQAIVKDLVNGDYDWLIYPEGSMIKSKEIEKHDLYISHTPYRTGHIRTGSAVLALKSHLYRKDLIEAHQKGNKYLLDELRANYDLEYSNHLHGLETYIVPLSITYYPIRPGHNKLELYARKMMEKISPRLIEELQIEGNLLTNSEINLHFGQPICLSEYIKITRDVIYQIPIIQNETKTNFIIKYFKHRLTTDIMTKIYSNIEINFDHIFTAVLRHVVQQEIDIIDFKRIIYAAVGLIRKSKKHSLNKSVSEENLCKLFIDEEHKEFDEVFQLAKNIGEIEQISDKRIVIHKVFINTKYDFHEVRTQNAFRVIYNEFSLLDIANNIVKRVCRLSSKELEQKIFDELIRKDRENYERDYEIFYDKEISKNREIGYPFFIDSKIKSAKKIKNAGVLLCHGYKSCPKEVEALAKYLNGFGLKVYAVRLKGHATAPVNMKYISWCDWYDSLQRGYAILNNICSRVVIVGFSTGGLLALLSAANKNKEIAGLVSINAALKLNDIRAKFVPTINIFNDILVALKIDKGKFEYIDGATENTDLNYKRNYFHGVEELGKLMKKCEQSLENITVPTLVIQADKDPVINPISGKMIFDKIATKKKILIEPRFSNHIIINSLGKEEIFEDIKQFLCKINLI